MIKLTIIFLGFIILFSSCSSNFEGFKIKGTVEGGKGKTIYITYQTKTDSPKINLNLPEHFLNRIFATYISTDRILFCYLSIL
mgnify:CR=1 FL=1